MRRSVQVLGRTRERDRLPVPGLLSELLTDRLQRRRAHESGDIELSERIKSGQS
jgi:hypothetical protein